MKRMLVPALIAAAWFGYGNVQDDRVGEPPQSERLAAGRGGTTVSYTCDGRTHCSQMTSCAEATFFLRNCPGTKMDGDRDGIPCERQWCR
jgi:hypothetical protein